MNVYVVMKGIPFADIVFRVYRDLKTAKIAVALDPNNSYIVKKKVL